MLLLRVTSMSKGINFTPFLPAESTLQPEGLLHTRGMAASGLRPLCNIPHCCLRRSLDRVSVPVWLVILSDQLRIVALVSRYPTNKLIPSGHIRWQEARRSPSLVLRHYAVLATVSSSYPLHQAVSQTLLTRPPLVSEAASCFLLPFDLHVLGLPPAFNLSHDQTLQFKSLMLKELNFVMNYVFTLETWYSFFVLRR